MRTQLSLLPPAEMTAALPDIPGGEPNLLPVASLDAPLEVKVPAWLPSLPQPTLPERLWVFWDGQLVAEREWTAPIPADDLVLLLQALPLQEGAHELRYRVMVYNQEETDSEPITVTVDRTPPALGGNGGRLAFDTTVVTAEYLEQNQDRLDGQMPDYNPMRPGDAIQWYWDSRFQEDALVDTRVLVLEDIGQTVVLPFSGDMIRARGDGTRMARYRLQDRAGNRSEFSVYVDLEVSADDPPRTFPWPRIKDALGSGLEVSLDPLKAASGATVVIPDEADLREGDEVWVQWAAQDAPGSCRTNTPLSPGGYEFRIAKECVAFHIGRTLPVHYEIIDRKGRLHTSDERRVKLGLLSGLQAVQVAGLSGINLSLATVPEAGTRLTLNAWPLISADQFITIQIDGSDSALQPRSHRAIDQRQLTAVEVDDGIGKDGTIVIPKQFLAGLKLNFPFTVKAFVSFDLGQTWPSFPNFPTASINLVA